MHLRGRIQRRVRCARLAHIQLVRVIQLLLETRLVVVAVGATPIPKPATTAAATAASSKTNVKREFKEGVETLLSKFDSKMTKMHDD
jgi:hypothetical protein